MPLFFKETIAHARTQPLWAAAFFLTALIPFMIIFARVGFEICGGLVGLMFLWHSFRTRTWGWLRDPVTVACLVLCAWMLLVVQPLAVSPSAKWVEAVAWIRFPLMFTAMRFWVLALPAARATLAAMLALLMAVLVIDSWWQLLTGTSLSGNPRTLEGRLTGPFDYPKIGLFIGKMANVSLGVCVVVAALASSRRWVIGSLVLWVIVVLTVLLSGERSAFLMTAMAMAVMALLMMLREKRLRAPFMVAAVAAMAGVVALYHTSPWVKLRADQGYEVITNYRQSDYGALAISAYDIGREHWLHGSGIRGYRGLSPDLYYKGQMFRGLHPHNAFLEMFAEAGIVGVAIMLSMVGALLRHAVQQFRATQGIAALLPAAAMGVLVQHFFPLIGMQSFFSNWAAVNLWFCLALAFSAIATPSRGG